MSRINSTRNLVYKIAAPPERRLAMAKSCVITLQVACSRFDRLSDRRDKEGSRYKAKGSRKKDKGKKVKGISSP